MCSVFNSVFSSRQLEESFHQQGLQCSKLQKIKEKSKCDIALNCLLGILDSTPGKILAQAKPRQICNSFIAYNFTLFLLQLFCLEVSVNTHPAY